MKDWRRPLGWDELVIPVKEAAARSRNPDDVRIILKSQLSPSFGIPPAHFMRTSTLSLYDNVSLPHSNFQSTPTSNLSGVNSETSTLVTHSLILRQFFFQTQ